MSRFLVTFFVLVVYTGFQQTLQASLNSPKYANDSLYYLKFREAYADQKFDSAIYFSTLLLENSQKIGDDNLEIRAIRSIAFTYKRINDFDNAIKYYYESVRVSRSKDNELLLPIIYNDIGLLYDNYGKYDSALANYYRSLDYAEKLNQQENISYALNNIGVIYSTLNNIEAALNTYLQSLEIKENNGIINQRAVDYRNIGDAYNNLAQPRKSLQYSYDAIAFCDSLGCSDSELAAIYNNMGQAFFQLKDYELSIQNLEKALELATTGEEIQIQVYTLRDLATVENILGNTDVAFEYLGRSLTLSEENNLLESRKLAYQKFYELYRELGDYENAFKYQNLYTGLKDTLFNEEIAASMRDIVVNYETREAQETISAQDREIQQRKQINFLFGLVILLTIAIIIRFILDLNQKKKMNERLDKEVERKTRQLRTALDQLQQSKTDLDNLIYNISHEIRGPLATLMGLIKVGKMEYGSEDTIHTYLNKLDETADHLNSILKRMIIINSINHYDTIVKDVEIKEVVEEVLNRSSEIQNGDIGVQTDFDGVKSVHTDASLLATVLENIVDNSIKYKDKKEESPNLDIKVRPGTSSGVDIILSDNGIGFDAKYKNHIMDLFFVANEEAGEGIGLHHAKLAVQKLKGDIEVASSRKPTTFIIHLPDIQEPEKEEGTKETVE